MAQSASPSMRKNAGRSTVFAVVALVACSRGDTITGNGPPAVVPVPPTVVSISVAPLADTLRVGEQLGMTATLRDSAGNVLTDRSATWTSTDSAVATVASGLVSAVAPGAATIVARSGAASAAGAVVVYVPKVSSIVLAPSVDTLFTTQQAVLVPTLRDQMGRLIDLVLATNVTWSSSDAAVTAVDASGRITGVSAGSSTITLAADGVNGTAAVLVRLASPPASIDGDWTMTLSPSPSCRDRMPPIARERHYVVHFTQIGPDLQNGIRFGLTISSPTLEVANPNENGGNWDGATIGFGFIGDTGYDGWSSTDLHDHLSATETLDFDGSVVGIVNGSEIVATMSGDVEYWNGPRSFAGPTVGCRATDHVVTLQR